MKTVDKFEIPVQQVVDALRNEELSSIAVVGRKESGALYIASSTSAPDVLELFGAAVGQIDSGEFDE